MTILQIEHKVPNYEGWKKVFDSDPIDRKGSGVKHYLIFRPVDDPNHVIVHLGFDHASDAEQALSKLQQLWKRIEGSVIVGPQAKILEVVDAVDL